MDNPSNPVQGNKWLTQVKDIAEATDGSLRLSLLTCDGCGVRFKEQVLEELLRRARANEKR